MFRPEFIIYGMGLVRRIIRRIFGQMKSLRQAEITIIRC